MNVIKRKYINLMKSKTPKFDKLVDDILVELQPFEFECIQKNISKYCEKKFKITEEDIEFYKLFKVPPQRCCPTCRRQRRHAFNNRINLYKRRDDAPGNKKEVISYVPPGSPFTVYNLDYYRSANWDPVSYATEYDSSKPFFDQFYDLRLKVPQYSIVRDPSSVNSEYSLNGRNLKNGYMVSGGNNSENLWYCIFTRDSREIMDSHNVKQCERCYETVFVRNLNTCIFCYHTSDCINSSFLFDCRNCQDCFGCVNLRNKKYCFFNQQLSKEQYEEKIQSINLDSRKKMKEMADRFWEFVKINPMRAPRTIQAIDSTGVLIVNSKNCHNVVSCDNAEHERYVDMVTNHKDSMDVYTSGFAELIYESSWVGDNTSNIKFSFASKNVSDSEFLINCHHCQYCFACVGLENKNYHIFNRPYKPEEYFMELDRIKTSMLLRGEYGEFLPYRFSTFAYNGAESGLSYPLDEKETNMIGALYQPNIELKTEGLKILRGKEIPDSIFDVEDDILNKVIICEKTGRPFKITKSELEFYRKFKLSLPRFHPLERMKNTYIHLWSKDKNMGYPGICKKCNKKLSSLYDPADGWCLYCEECYKREVY